jgi:hypothetical protein
MKGSIKILALVLGMASMTLAAKADPVNGMLSINGYDNYSGDTVTFLGQGQTNAIAATGSFTSLFTSPNQTLAVDLNNFSFGSDFNGPAQIFTVSNNGITATLTLDSIKHGVVESNGDLWVRGIATLSETGYQDSLGTFDLTSQGGTNANVTFSATAVAPTPEPSSLLLMGTGLLGSAGAFFRRRKVAA